jgi:hypothetical protein
MAEAPQPRVVVQTSRQFPRRGWAALALALGVLGVAYGLFELGRYMAGFSRLAAFERERELKAQIRERDAAMADLQRAAADLDTLRTAQAMERSELSKTIGDLQAQVARQTQELTFYKGILVQNASGPEVKIQEFTVARAATAGRYVVRITLVQPGRPETVVSGNVVVVLEGTRGAAPVKLELPALTGGSSRELPFSFRYFEHLTPEIEVPGDVSPERLNLEVRSSRRGIAPVSQTFLWSIETIGT